MKEMRNIFECLALVKEDEHWKAIIGFEGLYEVCKDGRIRNNKGKCLKQFKSYNGYYKVGLYKNKKRYNQTVHVAVLEAFNSKRPEGLVCCHTDGNSINNHISNLRWGTQKENIRDSVNQGTHVKGERCGGSKLKELEVVLIKKLLNHKIPQRKIGKMFKISQRSVLFIKQGINWGWV